MSVSAKKFAIATAAVAVFSAPTLWAQERYYNESGLYISGAYGGYKSRGGAFDDENDLLEAKLGYQFNEIFSLEANYADFGNFGEDEVDAKFKGLGLSLRARLPLSETFGIYAKGGAFSSDTEVDAFGQRETYDEVDPFIGAGVDFRISEPLFFYAEYNRYRVKIDEDDFGEPLDEDSPKFDTATVGLKFVF